MRIPLATNTAGFTRPQWLLLICLCMLAFEGGVRFAKKRAQEKVVTRTITTNTVITNVIVQKFKVPEVEPDETVVTNFPPLIADGTSSNHLVRQPEKTTNNYAKVAGGPKQLVIPEPLKGDLPPEKRKAFVTNRFVTYPSQVQYGIRIAVP